MSHDFDLKRAAKGLVDTFFMKDKPRRYPACGVKINGKHHFGTFAPVRRFKQSNRRSYFDGHDG